jgi:hypothetical protein
MSEQKIGIRGRLAAEAKSMLFVFSYLFFFLFAFTTYRRLLLAKHQIPFFQYGYSLIEAFLLAKIIVFGRFLHIGERFSHRPLIVPTLYKTLCFGLIVLAFSVLERILLGWWHGDDSAAVFESILGQGMWEILARTVMQVTALVPLFVVLETSRVLGPGKLFELFFKRRTGIDGSVK